MIKYFEVAFVVFNFPYKKEVYKGDKYMKGLMSINGLRLILLE